MTSRLLALEIALLELLVIHEEAEAEAEASISVSGNPELILRQSDMQKVLDLRFRTSYRSLIIKICKSRAK